MLNWEALDHFRELGLKGAVITLNGRVEAFTLGELLNRNTAVVHVEKANTEISRSLQPDKPAVLREKVEGRTRNQQGTGPRRARPAHRKALIQPRSLGRKYMKSGCNHRVRTFRPNFVSTDSTFFLSLPVCPFRISSFIVA